MDVNNKKTKLENYKLALPQTSQLKSELGITSDSTTYNRLGLDNQVIGGIYNKTATVYITELKNYEYNLSNFKEYSKNLNQLNLLNNTVLINSNALGSKSIDFTGIIEDKESNNNINPHTNYPLLRNKGHWIFIPRKIKYSLERFVAKGLLSAVDTDREVAIEKCLLFTTQLTSTYFEFISGENTEGWKSLMAEYLRLLVGGNGSTYKNIRIALEAPLSNGSSIIECDDYKDIGKKCFNYRLGESYLGKGLDRYELKTKEVQVLLEKHNNRVYQAALANPISKNLMEVYSQFELPDIKQIEVEAHKLINNRYLTKKGKKLTFLNKHPKTYFKYPKEFSFVEDSIRIFKYLTENGFMTPVPGDGASGGRIVDSFTLMPSWIRNMITIGGKKVIECDYSCLHPNIASSLYGGNREFLTHQTVGEESGVDVQTVKKEHLSFFNKKVWQMEQSPLHKYYQKNQPQMIENITREKKSSIHKHKETSRKMFKKEVEIMTDVIIQLNKEGIFVGYVYDALFFEPSHAQRVEAVMNETILQHGVKTLAKLSVAISEIVEVVDENVQLQTCTTQHLPVDENSTKLIPADEEIINISNGPILGPDNCINLESDQIVFDNKVKNSMLEEINKGITPVFISAMIRFCDGISYNAKVTKINNRYVYGDSYVTHNYLYQGDLF